MPPCVFVRSVSSVVNPLTSPSPPGDPRHSKSRYGHKPAGRVVCASCLDRITRREALKHLTSATAGVALLGGIIRGQTTDITIGGKPVEIACRRSVRPRSASASCQSSPGRRRRYQSMAGSRSLTRRSVSSAAKAPDTFKPVRAGQSGRALYRAAAHDSISRRPPAQPVQRLTFDAQAPDMSFLLPKGPAPRPRAGRTAVRPQGPDRSHAQRSGRLPAPDARRARADPVAGGHGWVGDVHPSPAGRLRLHRHRREVHACRCRLRPSTCSLSRRAIRR